MKRLFKMPVKHRAVGANTQLVSRAMDVDPVAAVSFVFANLVADFWMENLCSTARHAAHACVFELLNDLSGWSLFQKLKPIDFDRRPSFQVELRKVFMQ